MKVHMMGKHAEEKSHRCNQCNYAGVNTGALRAHMVIHTGEELFKCKRWEKPFKWRTQLARHSKMHLTLI